MAFKKMKIGDFTVQVNPESISYNRSIEFDNEEPVGVNAPSPKFVSYGPEIISFQLIFDGTGVIPGSEGEGDPDDVNKQLIKFEKAVFNYSGSEHGPKPVSIQWGSLALEECFIEQYDITYTLFSPDGNPIRATVDLSFQGHTNEEKREKEANKSSPDLTHVKTVRMGDELYLMCNEVYKDPRYLLQVAENNGIINFRRLEVGKKILFPPLER
jgi:hypothetical protein